MKLITILSSIILAASMTVSGNTIIESNETFTTVEEAHIEASLFHNPEAIAIDAIEVLELQEEVSFDFDTQDYLPVNFNPLKGKNDIDWSKIELIELEEEVSYNFNIQDYLPNNFNPHSCTKIKMVCNK